MIKRLVQTVATDLGYSIFIKKLTGISNILSGGFIVAANHTSYLDIVAMVSVFYKKKRRYIRYIANKKLKKDIYTRTAHYFVGVKETNLILIDKEKPGKEPFQQAMEALKNGDIIGMYPEGGRSPDGKLRKGKTGAVRLALWSQKPIVPIGIIGAYQLMPKGKKIPRFSKKIVVNIGKPIYLRRTKRITKKLLRNITDEKVMKEIARLSHQQYKP